MARHAAAPDPRGGARKREDEKEPLRGVRGKATEATPGTLDRLIHERMRLGIVSALAANESLTFNELKGLLQTTDGNLACTPASSRMPGTSPVRNRSRGGCRRRPTR